MSDTKNCPYCNKEINSLALKCNFCGKSLLDDDESDEVATNLYWDGLSGRTQLADTPDSLISDPLEKIKSLFAAKYEIIDEVGRGGMAIVYKAVQKNLNRQVALKILPQHFVHDNEYIIRFHREAKEVAKMNHPNIVTIFDEGEIDGYHYLSMEFLEGKDLQEIIKAKGTLNAREVENVIPPIAEALDYVHQKGLVHRDIKSSNIFILNSGRAVLTDFGIAKTAGKTKLTQVGSIIGTPEYMSPEQADGLEVDGRGDLYSLAVVTYEALTGRAPFKADNPIILIRKIIDEIPLNPRKLNSDVPKWLDEIIMKCLEKNPDNRIQNGQALADSIREHKIIIGEKTKSDLAATLEILKDSDNGKKTQKFSKDFIPTLERKSTVTKSKKTISTTTILSVAAVLLVAFVIAFSMGIFDKQTEILTENKAASADSLLNQDIQNTKPIISIAQAESLKTDSIIRAQKAEEETRLKIRRDREAKNQQAEQQRQLQINLLETKIATAEIELKDAKRKYDHAQRMRERNLISPGDFNIARERYEQAVQSEKELRQQLSRMK